MANRHKKKSGGKVEYNAQDSNVMKEAHERKDGGACEMKASGGRAKHRMDKKKRASGGGVGADKHPFSSAHRGGM